MDAIRSYMLSIPPHYLGVEMEENKVNITTLFHKGLHNKKYLNSVATILSPFVGHIEWGEIFKKTLKTIKAAILEADAIFRLL